MSADGYTLVPSSTEFVAGRAAELRFVVDGPGGQPLVLPDASMQLFVVRRDLYGFQRLHPSGSPGGTWTSRLALPLPGVWRAYAEFAVTGAGRPPVTVTLGVDLVVAGDYRPVSLPVGLPTADVADLNVSYVGRPLPGSTTPVQFRFDRAGGTVALDPYLGSVGRLVVLRDGDMASMPVRPDPAAILGQATFWLAVPSPGRYRMYLEFRVDSVVRLAEFTVDIR